VKPHRVEADIEAVLEPPFHLRRKRLPRPCEDRGYRRGQGRPARLATERLRGRTGGTGRERPRTRPARLATERLRGRAGRERPRAGGIRPGTGCSLRGDLVAIAGMGRKRRRALEHRNVGRP
jgi:hypothetical protein